MKDLLADRVATPIGDVVLVADGDALVYVDFAENEARQQRLLTRRFGAFRLTEHPGLVGLSAPLARYFAGDLTALDDVPVSPGGTPFQARVWLALRTIPAGATRSYGALAAQLGVPAGAQAVGIANSLNPISIVLPCHRVIGADQSLTGYAGGLERKRWLLRHEGARFKDEPVQAAFALG